jgi:alpha-L-arabinofuranosidase
MKKVAKIKMKLKLTKTKLVKLLLIFIISFSLSVLPVKTLLSTTQIRVDVNNVLSDVSNNPVGININFLRDNTQITNPLKDIKIGSLRYPIGELADYYLFDKDNPAKPKVAINDSSLWFSKLFNADGTWKSKLSFDDFISICQSVGAEPFIMIGIDAIAYTGDAPHASPEEVLEAAVEWVRYANIVKGYGVKYWEIGNESNLNKDWTAETYANTVVEFSRAMKAVDPSIKIGANGMRTKENDDWWDRIMPVIKDDVDFLITHQYSWIKDYKEWKNDPYEYDYNIQDATKAIETYNPSLRLNVTENSSFNPGISHPNNTWKMLHNFEVLGQTLRFNKVDYVHFWTSRWLKKDAYSEDFSAFDSNYNLMPMGYPLKVWSNFLKKKMVYSTKKAGVIRSWASYDPDDNSLNVFLLNKDEVSQAVTITLDNYTGSTQNERWVLKGPTPESTDVSWEKSGSVSVNGSKISTKLNPLSVTVITLQGN